MVVIIIIKARVKYKNKLYGYITYDNKFISIIDTYKYNPKNVIRLKDGTWKAKKG